LINEVLEVQGYLNGENINKKCLYRICFLLAKWFKQQGMSHIEIRQAIFDWGKKYHIYIEYNVNSIIYQALDDKQRLKDNIVIKISEQDVKEIKNRFDTKNTRLAALAMLCIAKGYADRDREFQVSLIALSAWLGIANTNLSGLYIKELIDFGYIEKISDEKVFSWNKKTKSKHIRYKINVPLSNDGIYEIFNNDIHKLYEDIFLK
jgi:hypothetical protein